MNAPSIFLKLTDLEHQLPDFLNASQAYHLDKSLNPQNLIETKQHLTQLNIQPQHIIFDATSPSLLLSSAFMLYPKAQFLIYQTEKDVPYWLDLHTQEHYYIADHNIAQTDDQSDSQIPTAQDSDLKETLQLNSDADLNATLASTQNASQELLTESIIEPSSEALDQFDEVAETDLALHPLKTIQASHAKYAQDSDQRLLHEIFKHCAWGLDQKDNQNKVDELMQEIAQRSLISKDLVKRAEVKRKQGIRAKQLTDELNKNFKALNQQDFQIWFDEVLASNTATAIHKHLNLQFENKQNWRNKQKQKTYTNHSLVISPTINKHQAHPNSLRHLSPSSTWDILIDETGTAHENIQHLNHADKNLGRYVALAIPQGVTLPALSEKFHATEEKDSQVLDHVIQTILNHPVGVIGISAKDDLAYRSPRWLSNIEALIKLVLRLLPLSNDHINTVNILIEERGIFTNAIDLLPLQQLISAQLESLDEARYKDLKLTLKIIAKSEHPYNGYVDTLAHCWGGSSAQKRLAKAKFKGHCFLLSDKSVIERIYSTLNDKIPLKPQDWYQAICAVSQEPEQSLLHTALNQIGEMCQHNQALWKSYLQEVSDQLGQKNYQPNILSYTLGWLKNYQPDQAKFPPHLHLEWLTAQLASDNHMGRMNTDLIGEALSFGAQLHDEDAPLVAQLYLRIAVAATNTFEFAQAKVLLDHAKQPIAVMGRLNYAKWLSSQGQIAAFTQNYTEAEYYFNEAITEFRKLSDSEQAAKNILQTQTYQLINAMEQANTHFSEQHILTDYFKQPLDKVVVKYAGNTQAAFQHHVLVRAMVFDQNLNDIIQQYLALNADWQTEDSHPWMLINFWRAWLLYQDQQDDRATELMQWALQGNEESQNVTLRWIKLIIATVAHRLNLISSTTLENQQAELLELLPEAPHQAWQYLYQADLQQPQQWLDAITACLPFNFK